MNMAGPLPTTKRGNKYILVICDHFTKFVQAYSLRGMTTEEVAEDAIKYCLIFEIPEAVLTDRGTNFTSQLIESLWKKFDVNTLRTTAYHPQADGITERFNRTFKIKLAQFVDQHKQDDWDLKLDKLCFACNTAVHETTKFSPFELFGRIPKFRFGLWPKWFRRSEGQDRGGVDRLLVRWEVKIRDVWLRSQQSRRSRIESECSRRPLSQMRKLSSSWQGLDNGWKPQKGSKSKTQSKMKSSSDDGSPPQAARDPLRRTQKKHSSKRNEKPEVGCSSKLQGGTQVNHQLNSSK